MMTHRTPIASSFAVLFLVLFTGACHSAKVVEMPPAPESTPAGATHESLNATLWVQTSVEYDATAREAYELARIKLDEALADHSVSAAIEQLDAGGFEELPPAVVLDVDETVLDNSPFQARLIKNNAVYSQQSWSAWVDERKADAIPGAVAFTQYAHDKGVRVIYLTNRRSTEEQATRDNLAAQGFPLDDDYDVVLTRGEVPDWSTGDKASRRRAVAADYRILLLVGDNLGDFMSDVDVSPEQRATMAAPYDAFWGTRWIMLPNPEYGSWEGATFGFDYSRPPAERTRMKYESLDGKQ